MLRLVFDDPEKLKPGDVCGEALCSILKFLPKSVQDVDIVLPPRLGVQGVPWDILDRLLSGNNLQCHIYWEADNGRVSQLEPEDQETLSSRLPRTGAIRAHHFELPSRVRSVYLPFGRIGCPDGYRAQRDALRESVYNEAGQQRGDGA